MDRYLKTVLTIIAITLTAIAVRLWEPQPAQAAMFESAPTVGDMIDVDKITDATQKNDAALKLMRRIPLVRVHGSVSIDR